MTTGNAQQGWRFAIDRGGTFTDVVARDPEGTLHTHKVLSRDPRRPGDPAVRAIADVLARVPGSGRLLESVRLGTTVATNALLERKGEPTLLVTTRGLGDVLRIGYQNRPDIFARAIRLPPALYSMVIEANERIDASGSVLEPLDEASLLAALSEARAGGLRAVAIALLHGLRNPDHERHAARLAVQAGFEEVVVSHEVAPLVGLVARGDSAVADAYLSPVLGRYVRDFLGQLAESHGHPQLLMMQSNGGLVDPDGFRGISAVLSGPAGGVVGLASIAGSSGLGRLIGFDMGGTSTDVSLYAGELPRRLATEIDGVRLHSPMMDVHTIAAGGGSIVRYADGRLQVGPESAGADPGPACYRRGGPATVTDCNVVLGRIRPERFPEVFGTSGNEPLDPGASRDRLEAMAGEIARDGTQLEVEQLAEAFLTVAVSRMANAIRELALGQGHDPSQFALLPFGGAAGQHACAVAEALGIDSMLLDPLAGVLSAYGIGLARRRCLRRRSVVERCDTAGHERVGEVLDELEQAARYELRRQGIADADIALRRTAGLRLPGSDSEIEVEWGTPAAMQKEFAAAHHRLYGFADDAAIAVLASCGTEASEREPAAGRQAGSPGTLTPPARNAGRDSPPTLDAETAQAGPLDAAPNKVKAWSDGAWHEIPLNLRDDLLEGTVLDGPALIAEQGATVWIAPGWVARSRGDGRMLLARTRVADHGSPVGEAHADPMRLEVFNGRFMRVAEQMGAVLQATAVGQHQGTARLLLRALRRRRRPGRKCAAHAGAPGLDGRERHAR